MADEVKNEVPAGNFIQDFITEDIAEGGAYEGNGLAVKFKGREHDFGNIIINHRENEVLMPLINDREIRF